MEFKDLSLHDDLFKGVTDAGYTTCTPVQEEVFKIAFQGRDLFVQSQTGTGKTAAYLLTIFQRLLTQPELKNRKALILVPTRELAVQVQEEAAKLLAHVSGISVGAFYGGVGYAQQIDLLRDKVDIMIGTPGRLIDLHQSGNLLLNTVGFLVIDEADRMFDMGFIDDLRKIIRFTPPTGERQTMLFSATLNVRVKTLAWDYANNAAEISIEPEHITVEEITHELYHVGSDEKMKLLLGLMKRENPSNALIFCNTRHDAEIVSKRLKINGIDCEYIIGDLPQKQRQALIDGMKEGTIKILVATDVAARGLDIQDLALVVNYDVPMEAENYVHRCGRTARAGKTGKAITLADERYVYGLPAIERYIDMKLPVMFADDSLFIEDKSAGMRIRFEHAREFAGRDSGRSGGGRPSGTRRSEPRRGGERGGQRPAGGRPRTRPQDERFGDNPERLAATRDKVREAAGLPVAGKPGAGQDSRRRRGEKARREPQVAASSSRQARIAQATGGNAPSRDQGGKRHDERGQQQNTLYQLPMEERIAYYRKKYGKEGEKRDESRAQSGQNQRRNAAQPSGGKPRGGDGSRTNRQQPQQSRQGPKTAAKAPAAEPKKSLISRIVNLFKK